MPRIRTVKPGYPKHKKVRAVSRDARLLNVHLWNLADDEGRLQELANWIIGEVFPTDSDVTPGVLHEWLRELHNVGLIHRYEVDGEAYIQCHDFADHQVISRPQPSSIPPPDNGDSGDSATDHGAFTESLHEDSTPEVEGEREVEGEKDTPPASAGTARAKRPKVNGKAVTDVEYQLATEVVEHFNLRAGSSYTADAHLKPVVGRVREKPELTADDHRGIIDAAFRDPWWDGRPGVEVVYGNAKQFEKQLEVWRSSSNGTAPGQPTEPHVDGDPDGVWESAAERILAAKPHAHQYLSFLHAHQVTEESITLAGPAKQLEWIQRRYLGAIQQATGRQVELVACEAAVERQAA